MIEKPDFYSDWLEENPYDVTAAAEHHQTPSDFIRSLDSYRESREKKIWELWENRFDKLTSGIDELIQFYDSVTSKQVKRKLLVGRLRDILND